METGTRCFPQGLSHRYG